MEIIPGLERTISTCLRGGNLNRAILSACMYVDACVRECVSACVVVQAIGTLDPHRPVASASMKRRLMQLSAVHDSSCVII